MNTLKNHLPVGPVHVQHAFVAQHAGTINIDDGTQKILQLGRLKSAIRLEDKTLDVVLMGVMVRTTVLMRGMIAVLPMGMIMLVFMLLVLEKVGINVQLGIKVEATQVKHFAQRHLAKMHGFLRCARVHVLQTMHQRRDFIGTDQIGLADENLVGKADLPACFLAFIELRPGMLGVHQRQDRVEQVALCDFIVHEESLGHRTWIGQARRLDHDAFKFEFALALLLGQIMQCGTQIVTDRAADTAVAHLDDALLRVRHQDIAIDVFLAKFIFNDGYFLAVRLFQHAFEQRRFARAEKARQDGCRNQTHRVLVRFRLS